MTKQELLRHKIQGAKMTFQGYSVGVLANWAPVEFTVDNVLYRSAEQFYMAEKARFFGDTPKEEMILNTIDPKRVQELGRKIRLFDETAWMVESKLAMYRALIAKFSQGPMKKTLLETGDDVLVYCNPADLNWGAGIDMQDKRIQEPFEWPGDNKHGFLLMEVRDQLNEELEPKRTP